MNAELLTAYLVDDEPLALRRLTRMLESTGRIRVLGSTSEPFTAVKFLTDTAPDLLFLDIQMPDLTGFELLAKLPKQPPVIFTTAFDSYALSAFAVNSVDYLLKPIQIDDLNRAIDKFIHLRGSAREQSHAEIVRSVVAELSQQRLSRLSSKVGERIVFVDVASVTHIFSKDKLTFAVCNGKAHIIEETIADLEHKLDPLHFFRIHRSTLVNLKYVHEASSWIHGLTVKLKDEKQTELVVSRDRVTQLKERLRL